MIWKVDLPLWYLKKFWLKILNLLKFSTVYALNDQFSSLMFECKFAIISHGVIKHIKPWCQAGFVVNIIELFRIINIAGDWIFSVSYSIKNQIDQRPSFWSCERQADRNVHVEQNYEIKCSEFTKNVLSRFQPDLR